MNHSTHTEIDGLRPQTSPGGGWSCVLPGLLLALSVRFAATDFARIWIDLGYFLPLLMAWMGYRYGIRAWLPLLILALPALLRLDVRLTPALTIGLRFETQQYLLGLIGALAFVVPDPIERLTRYLRHCWRWSLLLAIAALAFTSYAQIHWNVDLGSSGSARADPGLLLVVLLVVGTVHWRSAREGYLGCLRSTTNSRLKIAMALVTLALLFCMMVVNYYSPWIDNWRFRTGIAYAPSWSVALCFAVPTLRIASGRRLSLVLILCLALTALCFWNWPALGELKSVPRNLHAVIADQGWQGFIAFLKTRVLVDGLCAVLLGAVLAPYWNGKGPAVLRASSTPRLLCAIIALQFVVLPMVSSGSYYVDPLIVGGVAFIVGVVWRDKALLAAPLFILVCYFGAAAISGHQNPGFVMSSMFRLGFVLFPFALAGVLANPSISLLSPAAARVAARSDDDC